MLLILTRKPGEAITLPLGGTQVVVTVNKTNDARASLKIEAPAQVLIMRNELLTQTPCACDAPMLGRMPGVCRECGGTFEVAVEGKEQGP